MPPLKLFGRKWLVATDDFVYPGLLELVIKIIWIVLYSLNTKRYYNRTFECTNGGMCVRVYLIGMLVLLALNIVLLLALINRSATGGICDIQARRCVAPILTCKTLLLIPEIGWNILGTIWIYTSVFNCPTRDHIVHTTILVMVLLDWFFIMMVVFLFWLVYDPNGRVKIGKMQQGVDLDNIKSQKVARTWVKRLNWIYWCVSHNKEKEEGVDIVAGLFKDLCIDTDLTPTDVIAGLIMVWEKQEKERQEKKKQYNYSTGVKEMFKEKPAWINIELGKHYLELSLAMYTWPMAIYVYCCLGLCRLCGHCRCSSCCRSKKGPTVKKDNCCECNVAGFQTLSGVSREDIIYCDFNNKLYYVQFIVIFDRKTKCVVVCIRGSMSFADAFTDFVAVPVAIDIAGLPANTMVHKGMWITAIKLKEQLDENKILERAFFLQPDYNLVLTGHSLGAGVAVLLGLLCRSTYPDLKVYGYATPGLLTLPAALYCECFVWSVGLNDDVVMCASIDNIKRLRSKMFKELQQSTIPKFLVLLKSLYYIFCGGPIITEKPQRVHVENQHSPETNFFAKAEENWQGLDIPLYPVGHILHISRIHETRRKFCRCCVKGYDFGKMCCRHTFICCSRRKKLKHKTFDMCWLPPESFNEMVLCPRLNLDHVPDTIHQAINGIILQQHLEIET